MEELCKLMSKIEVKSDEIRTIELSVVMKWMEDRMGWRAINGSVYGRARMILVSDGWVWSAGMV